MRRVPFSPRPRQNPPPRMIARGPPALDKQFQPQFQQSLYGELAFLRRVCKPEKKSFADLAKAANAGLIQPRCANMLSLFMGMG